MGGTDPEQFKKDWLTTLASTSGIMLTVCLMVLTILYTASSISLLEWQKVLITASIVAASISLMTCAFQSLGALGALILVSAHREKRNVKSAEVAKEVTARRARNAQWSFKIGMCFLIAAISLSFLFLNLSTFTCIFVN